MKHMKKGLSALIFPLILALLLCGCSATASPEATPADEAAAATPAAPTVAVSEQPQNTQPEKTVVTVSTVDELLAAIAPATDIQLEPGVYDLTTASDYGRGGSDYYHWDDTYGEGWELTIEDVSDFSISAQPGDDGLPVTSIVTVPRMANVLDVEDSSNISFSGIVMGHTEEPGVCSGGVLKLDDVYGALVDNCELFGCGTVGLDADDCENVTVQNSVIRHCTVGAAQVEHSRAVVIKDSRIYDCGEYILFEYVGSSDCAVLNCVILENSTELFLSSRNSKNINLLGCSVTDNNFKSGAFDFDMYGATVAGCEFRGNTQNVWYDASYFGTVSPSIAAVDMDGKELSEPQLESMSLEQMSWTPPAPETAPASMGGEVTVSTVDELLAAIAPNTTILLNDGVYDLSTASDYGAFGGKYYSWQNVFDGVQLVISNVDGLSIVGSDAAKVTIAATPRYANVLFFDDCDDLNISGLTAGHTQEPGECSGGVIYLAYCEGVDIQGCVLYGCGTIGVDATGCEKLTVEDTEIKECSYMAAALFDCEDVVFSNCNIHDIESNRLFNVYDCENALIDGKPLTSDTKLG